MDVRIEAGCRRCGGTERLIEGDGAAICLICVLGWGSYAALAAGPVFEEEVVAAAVPGRDPTVTALLHWSHRSPVPDCPLCAGRA